MAQANDCFSIYELYSTNPAFYPYRWQLAYWIPDRLDRAVEIQQILEYHLGRVAIIHHGLPIPTAEFAELMT